MKAFQISEAGRGASLTETAIPDPGEGEIRIKIEACGLNFADLLMMSGTYQDTPQPPFTLGMEAAGIIDATGPGVTEFSKGARVAVFGGQGGLAEFGCFSTSRTLLIPDKMNFCDAASFQIAYGTSHLALEHRARLQPGERLLVLGAAGGVGLTAVEIGKILGAVVIACARGSAKLKVARAAGADHLIDASRADIRGEVRALGGADVVYDPVGGAQFEAAFRACNPEARILPIGFASGDIPRIKANHLLVKNLSVMGLYWGGYMKFRPDIVKASLQTLIEWYALGRIKPHISQTFPLAEVEAALAMLRERRSAGKVLVTI